MVQSYIDSAVSKTCNLPSDFKPDGLYDELATYANDMKGFTFYRAGSRGNEPLEAVPVDSIDLDALITSGKIVAESNSIDSCKNGVCEL